MDFLTHSGYHAVRFLGVFRIVLSPGPCHCQRLVRPVVRHINLPGGVHVVDVVPSLVGQPEDVPPAMEAVLLYGGVTGVQLVKLLPLSKVVKQNKVEFSLLIY